MKNFTIVLMSLSLVLFATNCSSKPVSKEKATEIFDNIQSIGKSQDKGCTSSFLNEGILKEAVKKAGATEKGFAEYVQSEKGKKHMTQVMTDCMLNK